MKRSGNSLSYTRLEAACLRARQHRSDCLAAWGRAALAAVRSRLRRADAASPAHAAATPVPGEASPST